MPPENYLPLEGLKAVVTGAGRGIGRETALALARAGADVAVVARTAADLDTLAAELDDLGRKGVPLVCDVTDPEQVHDMASTAIYSLGGLDILVNNAGNASSHKFVGHPDELWHQMILLNLTSVYYVCKAIVPAMAEQRGGRIINVASTAAKVGARYVAAYTAAKHGVLGLTRALAAELVPFGITVNAVCPGYVNTPMTEASVSNIAARTGMPEEAALKMLEQTSPQGRLIEPWEVASMIVFLAQASSKGITGQAINIDGGAVTF